MSFHDYSILWCIHNIVLESAPEVCMKHMEVGLLLTETVTDFKKVYTYYLLEVHICLSKPVSH